ncbi:transposase [Actinopolyspora xinjiangensis]|uniref:transposase n=1 Tax=Actinopolyspora xinjiangensis TaxID=405564 RepID=UPI000AC2BE77
MRVSHETIYRALFLQARGQLRTDLKLAPRSGRARRVSPSRTAETRGKIPGMTMISDRPKEADDRAVPGFWEGDLIPGKTNQSQIATPVERHTRYTMLRPHSLRPTRRTGRLPADQEDGKTSLIPTEQHHLGPG